MMGRLYDLSISPHQLHEYNTYTKSWSHQNALHSPFTKSAALARPKWITQVYCAYRNEKIYPVCWQWLSDGLSPYLECTVSCSINVGHNNTRMPYLTRWHKVKLTSCMCSMADKRQTIYIWWSHLANFSAKRCARTTPLSRNLWVLVLVSWY